MAKRAIFWFRRDLRLADNPALLAAFDEADEVIPLCIIVTGKQIGRAHV